MNHRGKKLIAMTVSLAILLGIYASVRTLIADPEEEADPVTVAALDPDTLTSLSWTNSSDGTLELTRAGKDTDWSYAGDSDFPVNQSYPQAMLDALTEVSASLAIDNPSDLEEYGLENPGLTITATDSDGTVTSFSLGDQNEVTSEYYLSCSADEGQIYLVDDTLAGAFSYDLYDLVEMEELPDFGTVTSLSIQQPDGDLTLEYHEDSSGMSYNPDEFHWFLTQGENLTAVDTGKAQSLASAVTGLSWQLCSDYKADDEELAEYGLDDSALTVQLTYLPQEEDEDAESADSSAAEDTDADTTPQSFTLLIGEDVDGGTYARLGDSRMVYLISTETADSLRYAAASSLQPDEVCVLNWDQMQKIEVTYGGQTHTIEFSGATTEEVEDSEGETVTQTVNVYRSGEEELSGTEVEALLDAINALSVTARGGNASGEELISFTFYQEVDGYEELTLRLTAQDTASCVADFDGAACQTDRSAVNEFVTLAQAVFEN